MDAGGIRLGPLAGRPGGKAARVLAAAVACVCLGRPPALAARSFEYLHIEANAGASSGGHAAICFGDDCFHFQHADGGLVRPAKDPAARLDHAYRALGNRTIHAQRVEVDDETYARLVDAFEAGHRVATRQFENLDALREEIAFLRSLQVRSHSSLPAGGVAVPGAGYFHSEESLSSASATPSNAATSRLADRLAATCGTGCVERRMEALRAEISALNPAALAAATRVPAQGRFDPLWTGALARYRERLAEWLALDALHGRRIVPEEVLRSSSEAAFSLDAGATEQLRGYAAAVTEAMVRLFDSPRPDRGYPLLVGLARLQALETSIASGRLVVLDVYREDAEVIPDRVVRQYRSELSALSRERRDDFVAARAAFFAKANDEARWAQLETAANLLLETAGAAEGGRLRVHHDQPVPMREARGIDWPLPRVGGDLLTARLAALEDDERRYAAALRELRGYDVARRNCVTEIFRTIDAGLGPDSAVRLGGHVVTDGTLNFIPFVSASAVGREYGATSEERPSYRRLALARMREEGRPAVVAARESNVWTSRLYHRNAGDTFFLFFSEESPHLRPAFGLANLAAGSAAAAAGIVLLPFDRGATLREAGTGIAFSVPELFFVNLRKGSFQIVPYSWLTGGRGERDKKPGFETAASRP